MADPVTDPVLAEKLDHLQHTVNEVKNDVREIKDGAPLWRIQQLEQRWANLWKFVSLLTVAVLGSYLALYLTQQ